MSKLKPTCPTRKTKTSWSAWSQSGGWKGRTVEERICGKDERIHGRVIVRFMYVHYLRRPPSWIFTIIPWPLRIHTCCILILRAAICIRYIECPTYKSLHPPPITEAAGNIINSVTDVDSGNLFPNLAHAM